VVLGIIGCKASFYGTNPRYTTGELKPTIRNSRATIIISDLDVAREAVSIAAKECDILKSKIIILDTVPTSKAPKNAKGFDS
jgi:hypothetical protein